jgi:uncharacterized repeat protein (TIGR01451 family)
VGCLVVAIILVLGFVSSAVAMPVQFFYVPFPEDQVLAMLTAIENGGPSQAPAEPITSYITITAVADDTIIYYDQWEDGYDVDIANTYNIYTSTNTGGTQIWGDKNVANGAPPGVTVDANDVVNAGTVIRLENTVVTTTRQTVKDDFDGGDKIAATKTIAVTRTTWAAQTGTLFAGCVEVFDTNNWGTDYRLPVGENIPDATDYQMFEYTNLSIMAGQDGASVSVDLNGDGDFGDTGEFSGLSLAEGGSTYLTNVASNVNYGAHVVSTRPVQVHMLTGDIASNYESRDSGLIPTSLWSNDYYTPVSTPVVNNDERTSVWLYNPWAMNMTIQYQRRNGAPGTITATAITATGGAGTGGVTKQLLDNATAGTGSRLYSTATGVLFDATSSGTTTGSTVTVTHTTGNYPFRLMLVGVSFLNEPDGRYGVSSVTYAGLPLTRVSTAIAPAAASDLRPQTEVWALVDPPMGTANVIVTLPTARSCVVGVDTFGGVDLSQGLATALGTAVTSTGNDRNPSVTASTVSGQWVFDVVGARNTTVSVRSGQTQRWNLLVGNSAAVEQRGAGSTLVASGTSTAMTWRLGQNRPWAIIAVPIRPATQGPPFYAYSTTDSNSSTYTNNQGWDWSFTLIPRSMLTTQALVGLGIGRDPTSPTNPTENGNPVWVTPVGNGETPVRVYVDYDANRNTGALVDPFNNRYDVYYDLVELQQQKIYNPSGDQSGMLVYTLGLNPDINNPNANVKLAVAWGQDPERASAGAPGLDVGTSVPPTPEFTSGKDGLLYDDPATPGVDGDLDGDGYITCGDIIEWPIDVLNVSRLPVPDIVVKDTIPANTTYEPNTTFVSWDTDHDGDYDSSIQVPDAGTTPFPLDEGGFDYGAQYGSLAIGESFTVRFRVRIANPVTPGTLAIYNDGATTAFGWEDPVDDRVFLRARIGDYVWWDENENGIQDPTEGGIAGATVSLLDSNNQVVRHMDTGQPITSVTDATGAYDFRGLLPGTYRLQFLLPPDDPSTPGPDTELTTRHAAGSTALNDSDPYRSDDPNVLNRCRTDLITLVGGETNNTIDAGIVLLQPNDPTMASIGSFAAYVADGMVVPTWETTTETGTAGYYVERLVGDTWVRVQERLVPALYESPTGGSYSVVDSGASVGETLTYRLVEVEAAGRSVIHGPYEVTAVEAMPPREAATTTTGPGAQQTVRIPNMDMPFFQHPWRPWGAAVAVSNPVQLKIELTETGLYRIDAADLVEKLNLSMDAVRQLIRTDGLKLTNRGKTVAYLKAANNSALFFYGVALDSIYASANVYWLTIAKGVSIAAPSTSTAGPAIGLMPVMPNLGQPGTSSPARSFIDSVHVEQNLFAYTAGFHDPEADYWLWRYLIAGDTYGNGSQTLQVDAPGAVQGRRLTVSLKGMVAIPSTLQHHVSVYLNGTLLGDRQWTGGTGVYRAEFDIPAGVLVAGPNQVEVNALLDGGPSDFSVVAVDSVDLTFERSTVAVDGQLRLAMGTSGPVRVDGLASSSASVLDVSNDTTPRLIETVASGDDVSGSWVVFNAQAGKRYLVTAATSAQTPPAMYASAPLALWSTGGFGFGGKGADYIIITDRSLAQAATRLAANRTLRGLKTMVVTTADIYDAYNYGIPSPHAIKSFIRAATKTFSTRPTYVVLAGEGSYDYKNYTGNNDSLVPPLMIDTPDGLVASDVSLADFDIPDGVPEVAIGRIPASNEAELDAALAKIAAYESAPAGAWQQSVLLTADNADPAGDFPADSDNLAATLPASLTVTKAYLGALGRNDLRTVLLGAFANDLFINYIGHAAVDNWADEGLLLKADVPLLAASTQLPVVSALTCAVGQFALPGVDGLSEALVKRSNAGAIAVFAPTSMQENDDSVRLGTSLVANLFGPSRTVYLGQAVRSALEEGAAGGLSRQVLSTYCLLGDPALRVKW